MCCSRATVKVNTASLHVGFFLSHLYDMCRDNDKSASLFVVPCNLILDCLVSRSSLWAFPRGSPLRWQYAFVLWSVSLPSFDFIARLFFKYIKPVDLTVPMCWRTLVLFPSAGLHPYFQYWPRTLILCASFNLACLDTFLHHNKTQFNAVSFMALFATTLAVPSYFPCEGAEFSGAQCCSRTNGPGTTGDIGTAYNDCIDRKSCCPFHCVCWKKTR